MQEVNLLNAELDPPIDPFTIRKLAIAWGLLLVLLGVVTGWKAYGVTQIAQELSSHKQLLTTSKQEVEALQAAVKKLADPALVQKLATLSEQQREQQQLVTALKAEPMSSGFQEHLTELARIDMYNLWFDFISLTDGGKSIHLEGFSATAERVPLFLSLLAQGEAFSGYPFDGLQIQRETHNLVSFQVHGPLAENVR